jgi:hypothetical protein
MPDYKFDANLIPNVLANQTLIQSAVDPAFRGRVVSVHGLVMMGIPALGAIALGGLAEFFGLRLPVLAGAAIFIAFWTLAWHRRGMLRQSLEKSPAP